MGSSAPSEEKSFKEKLVEIIKKEVKQIMEEAVTKKFVHEDSASITSLCAAVETCVSHGLKRRALGLFKSSSTTALLHKVAKSFQPAAQIIQLVSDIESCDLNKRSSSGSESTSKLSIGIGSRTSIQKKNSVTVPTTKYLWIRLALIEKQLAKIIEYVVQNASMYYEKDAFVADPDYGSILSSLLVGPCALDYSKLKTGEHLWTDPPADELVQRHRISSGQFPVSPPIMKRPALNYKLSTGLSNSEDNIRSKDYVESLHQNNKSILLYGKNNVLVYLKDVNEPLAGYLSLHQCAGDLISLKWTPNQLMNGSAVPAVYDKSVYWEQALNIGIQETVYVHCHQDTESDWIVLVGQDGVQRPPIHFPRGGHLLAFLSCLENGLLPNGTLDPPLWSQRGKGKVFPKLKRKGSRLSTNSNREDAEDSTELEQSAADFVFRIVFANQPRSFPQIEEVLEDPLWKCPSTPRSVNPPATPRSTPLHSVSTTSSTSSSKSLDQQISIPENGEPLQALCLTMKRQIISRAFYGWLAHCRHLRTVRTHLLGLVKQEILKSDYPSDAGEGLTEKKWEEFQLAGNIDMKEIYRYVYFGGMAHSLRRKLWPILLAGKIERETPEALRKEYEDMMSEWLAVEAIVRQRDLEIMAANLAKLSSEGSSAMEPHQPITVIQMHESNEVFEDSEPIVEKIDEEPGGTFQDGKNAETDNGTFGEEGEGKEEKKVKGSEGKERRENEVEDEKGEEVKNQTDQIPLNDEKEVRIGSRSIDSIDSQISSPGGTYSNELLETFALNLHRIDKDVKRCDRNYWYFTEVNLDKLRNVMCTYVWEHMEMGYVQGMCDLAAPLLVILDDEAEAYGCFRLLMDRMSANFPSGGEAMDSHFANMRSLLQVLDHDLFALIRQNGDYTHFYFCYRWFLLDFKREFCYDDVFLVWETIWAARQLVSSDFVLFLALALLNYYRDIVLTNSMDFTDIIKFFNEMAERHDAKLILQIARGMVLQLQTLIENK